MSSRYRRASIVGLAISEPRFKPGSADPAVYWLGKEKGKFNWE